MQAPLDALDSDLGIIVVDTAIVILGTGSHPRGVLAHGRDQLFDDGLRLPPGHVPPLPRVQGHVVRRDGLQQALLYPPGLPEQLPHHHPLPRTRGEAPEHLDDGHVLTRGDPGQP